MLIYYEVNNLRLGISCGYKMHGLKQLAYRFGTFVNGFSSRIINLWADNNSLSLTGMLVHRMVSDIINQFILQCYLQYNSFKYFGEQRLGPNFINRHDKN
jgi:hypothetical protein